MSNEYAKPTVAPAGGRLFVVVGPEQATWGLDDPQKSPEGRVSMTRDEHIAQAQECAAHIEVMRAELRRDMRGPGLTAEDIQASAALISAVAAHGQLHAQIAQAMGLGGLADRPYPTLPSAYPSAPVI